MDIEFGSVWRKWDLHVHTPKSILCNHYNTDPKFNKFLKSVMEENEYNALEENDKKMYFFINQLFTKAIDEEIFAIGITDYYFIDGYRCIRNILDDDSLLYLIFQNEIEKDKTFLDKLKVIKLFPNIEFRTSVVINDSKLQVHVIFSDELSCNEIERNFINRLEIRTSQFDNTFTLSHDSVKEIGFEMKKRGIGGIGTDLYVGANSISVKLDEIKELVNDAKFRDKAIIVLAEEDQSKILWTGQAGLERAKYYQYSDAIFTSNPKTIKWCTSKECEETIDKKLPFLWGSDAHGFDRMFSFDKERFLWIKSDVTFRGLLYALYRFENRIFIGKIPKELMELRKREYFTIKNLSIRPNKKKPSRLWFDTVISFNPFMTTIIGNKGSGKSAVSDIIAYLSNSHKLPKASFLTKKRFLDKKTQYGSDFKANINFWDEERQPISKDRITDEFNSEEVEVIKYLPQNYIEEICNNLDNKFQDEINSTIFSYVPIQDRAGAKTIQELISIKTKIIEDAITEYQIELKSINLEIIDLENMSKKEHKNTIKNKLNSLREKRENHLRTKPEEITKPDDIASSEESRLIIILNEKREKVDSQIESSVDKLAKVNSKVRAIQKIKNDIEKLFDDSNEINEAYRKFAKAVHKQSADIVKITVNDTELNTILQEIIHHKRSLEILLNDEFPEMDSKISSLAEIEIDEIEVELKKIQNLYAKKSFLDLIILKLEEDISLEQQEYFKYEKNLQEWTTYKSMLDGDIDNTIDGTSIKELENQLNYLNESLEDCLREKREQRIKVIKDILEQIYRKKEVLQEIYLPVQKKIESIEALGNSNIVFKSSIVVNTGSLIESIMRLIDQRVDSNFKGTQGGYVFLENIIESTDYEKEESVIDFIKELYKSTTENIDRIDQLVKDREELNTVIGNLSYLEPKFTINADGKSLNELSPGERGIVLLIFYLALDKDNTPLVIDQPEDNLDNQSVYSKLVPAIVEAKKNRQIIIVTHNPNIAIACDSEGVIYCSQKAQGLQYSTGSIENEEMNNHIINVLEGTVPAFKVRRKTYKQIE